MIVKWIYGKVYGGYDARQFKIWQKILLSCLCGSFIGYHLGKFSSDDEDYQQYLTEFQSDEHTIQLLEKDQKPIFYYYYIPGDWWSIHFRSEFLKQAYFHHKSCHFMKINCAKHFNVCRQKDIKRSPYIQLMHPKKQSNGSPYEIIEYSKELSQDGIQAFLEVYLRFNYQEEGCIKISNKEDKLISSMSKYYKI